MATHFPPGPEDSSVCVFLSTHAPAAGAGAARAGRWRSITPHGERRSRPGPDRACSENTVLIFQNTILRHENLILAGPSGGTPDGSPRRGQLPRQRRAHPPPRAAGQGGGRTDAPRLQRQRAVGRMTHRLPGSRPDRSGSAARQRPGAGRSGAERLAVGGGGAPRMQRQRVVGRVRRRLPGSARTEAAPPRDNGRGQGALARSVWRWAGVALHACNGSVWWGVLGAVSRARARKDAAPPRDRGRGWPGSGAKRFAVSGGGAPRLQRQRSVERVTCRLPGSRPERCGSAARQGPGVARVRRGAGGAGRGECVPRSGYLGGVTTTLGGVATIYGCNSPQCGCNSPQHRQSGPKERFCSPGTGAPRDNARPTDRPAPRGCREAEPSHPSPARTGVPHGGDGRSAGAIAHRSPGRWKGARPQEGGRARVGAAVPQYPPVA